MNELPIEMLTIIFQNVYQVDELLSCKIVCKKWYSIIHQMIRLNSLVITENQTNGILLNWFDPNESIQFLYDYRCKVASKYSKIIKFNSKQPLISQLKKLFIYERKIWANSINCLRHLEVLGLNNSTLIINGTDISLNLPNLRVFSFVKGHQIRVHNLTLNCPKLEKLDTNINDYIFIAHPESIKELHALYFGKFMFDLVNCEYLHLQCGYFDQNILLKLNKLKELHINRKDLDCLNNFISQKNSLKRTNLKIYNLSLLSDSFTNLDQFDDTYRYYHRLDIDTIQFYGPNYLNLPNNVYFISTVDYNVTENYFWTNPNQLAREIIKKFVYLYELILSDEIRDVNQFIGILKDRVYLNTLSITAEFMPQNFFDQILSENCSIIEQLVIDNKNQLNFDFLLKFKELQCFKTDQQLTSNLIFKLFDKFELLESLKFRYKGSEVKIDLNDRKKFKLRLDGVRKVFDNLENLLSNLEIYCHKTLFVSETCLDNFIFNQ